MKQLEKLFKCIVGPINGFTGEGTRQWYYTLALTISVMLAWIRLPHDIAAIFTILSVIHLLSIHVFALVDFSDNRNASITLIILHSIILIVALITDWQFALISIIIMSLFLVLSPDVAGCNLISDIVMRSIDISSKAETIIEKIIAYFSNTLVFIIFIHTTCQLPLFWWWKLLIIVAMMGIHLLVDRLEEECVDILEIMGDVASEAFSKDR